MKKTMRIGLVLLMGLSAPFATARETLVLKYSTTPAGGEYATRHVHAVWVSDSSGKLIKTLARFGKKRTYNLVEWTKADGTEVDGITGATPSKHGAHQITWDFRNRARRIVPNAEYRISMELTDDEKKKNRFNRLSFDFKKDGNARRKEIKEMAGYRNIVFDYIVTPNKRPTVKNEPTRIRSSNAVQLQGNVTDTGGVDPIVYVHWGAVDGGTDPGKWEHSAKLGLKANEMFTHNVKGLPAGKTCYARCRAVNEVGETWAPSSTRFIPCSPKTVVKQGDACKYFEGYRSPGEKWTHVDFDDTTWNDGFTGIGYGDDDDETFLPTMQDKYLTVYLRKTFTVSDPTVLQDMVLSMDYDDGFVAFLNGHEVARKHVPENQRFDSPASGQREAGEPEKINLRDFIHRVKKGQNVLAVEVHNASKDSSDLSCIPELILWEP